MKILLVNGPNLNLLGRREPEKYGAVTLPQIVSKVKSLGETLGIEILDFQANGEGALIDFIHREAGSAKAMIFNPGAYTHTSVALRDAILGVSLPFVEVHLTNVYRRETFRHQSYFKDISIGQIVGLGAFGYELALRALAEMLAGGKI